MMLKCGGWTGSLQWTAAHKATFWAFWGCEHHWDLVPELLIWEVSDWNIRDKWVQIFEVNSVQLIWAVHEERLWWETTSRKIRSLSKIKIVFSKYCLLRVFFPLYLSLGKWISSSWMFHPIQQDLISGQKTFHKEKPRTRWLHWWSVLNI